MIDFESYEFPRPLVLIGETRLIARGITRQGETVEVEIALFNGVLVIKGFTYAVLSTDPRVDLDDIMLQNLLTPTPTTPAS